MQRCDHRSHHDGVRGGRQLKGAIAACFALIGVSAACARHPEVILHPQSGPGVRVTVELALKPEERQRGLMYRRDLGANAGMLFVFPQSADHSFWMKNTPLPLDMIFIGEDLRIAGIVANTVPFALVSRSIGVPSRYVLEVNGGFAERHGLQRGDRVELPNLGAAGS